MSTVAENIKTVQAKIREAAIDCGRNADEIQIIAISKYADKKQVVEAIKLGVSMFGESRPQQL
ncbi:YggS family pyridoxal phosphate-dependent enzyme, partial [bacterium]|nr:YggS family pyridoxal phosphate-dependent enzyme [bacterium]